MSQPANTGGGELHPAIKREHVNRTHFEQCFDDNRVEHPVQWCQDRQAVKNAPMSWLAKPLCGGADERLAPCAHVLHSSVLSVDPETQSDAPAADRTRGREVTQHILAVIK